MLHQDHDGIASQAFFRAPEDDEGPMIIGGGAIRHLGPNRCHLIITGKAPVLQPVTWVYNRL